MADTHTWKAPRTMNINLSRIVPFYSKTACEDCGGLETVWSPDTVQSWLLLEVHASIGVVNIRRLENNHLSLLYVVSPEFLCKFLPAHTEQGTESYQIVRIAWNGACSSDICEAEPLLAVLLCPAGQMSSNLILFVISLDPSFGLRITARYDVTIPKQGYVVSDLAITDEGDPMILWLCPRKFHQRFIVYQSVTDSLDGSRYLTEESTHNFRKTTTFPDRVSCMHIHGGKVVFFPSSVQVPLWTGLQTRTQGWDFVIEDTNLPELHAFWHSEAVGIPMLDYHHHEVTHRDLNFGAPTCVNTALKLIVNRKGYDASNVVPLRKGVFILKSVHYPFECQRFDPYASNGRLEHIAVACLADPPDLDNLPTIGLKVAVSPRHQRIALAAWRTLRVYAVEPLAFLSPECCYGSRKVHTRDNPDDYAFVNECGWSYHSNDVLVNGCIMLNPIELASPGVIYALEWRHEHELWALTNEGVCRWDIGVYANGQKMVSELAESAHDIKLARQT